eukprot:EG_transcript_18
MLPAAASSSVAEVIEQLQQEASLWPSSVPRRFVYLQVRPQNERQTRNPYDVMVVPHQPGQRGSCITLSAEGVTQQLEDDVEFQRLDEWRRQARIFSALLALPLFAQFRVWKTFYFWKGFIRRTTISRNRQQLEEHLFLLSPVLSAPLLKVRKSCLEIAELPMYRILGDTCTLDVYVQAQQKQMDKAWRDVRKLVHDVTAVLAEACRQYRRAQSSIDGALQQLRAEMALLEGQPPNSTSRSAGRFLSEKFGVDVSADVFRPSHVEQSRRNAECRRLTCFLKLADYMVVDALAALALKSMREVMGVFRYPRPLPAVPQGVHPAMAASRTARRSSSVGRRRSTLDWRKRSSVVSQQTGGGRRSVDHLPVSGITGDGWMEPTEEELVQQELMEPPVFTAEIVLFRDALEQKPPSEAFQDQVRWVVDSLTHIIRRVPRFLMLDDFKGVTASVLAEQPKGADFTGPDVVAIVTEDPEYQTLCDGLWDSLRLAFADVEAYLQVYHPFLQMYLTNQHLDVDRVRREDPSLDWFRDQLTKYRLQQDDCHRMRLEKPVGLFLMQTKALRDQFSPSPAACFAALQDLLPRLAREKNGALCRELTDAVRRLDVVPATVQAYVKHLEYAATVEAQMERLERQFETLSELFHLMDQEKILIPTEDQLSFNAGTVPAIQKLRSLLAGTEENREAEIRRFAHSIAEKMEELKERTLAVEEKAKDNRVKDEESDVLEVITYLDELAAELQTMREAEQEFAQYQELFGLPVTRLDELGEAARDVQDKLRLWTALRDWKVLTAEWRMMRLQAIDPEQMSQQVLQYNKTVTQLTRTLTANPVVPLLRVRVEEFKLLVPVLQCLRNPNLQKHHLQAIDEVVGRDLSHEADCTVDTLLQLRVADLKDEIQRVSNTATQEASLEELLRKVQNSWVGGAAVKPAELIVTPYKDQKDVFVLGTVDDVFSLLDDSLVTVTTILTSRFCTGALRTRTEKWEEELHTITAVLEQWLTCQRQWMYLEAVFTQTEIARQWPQDAKIFSAVDREWKDLMKRVYENPSVYRVVLGNAQLADRFKAFNTQLEAVHRSLERRLEEKRQAFPRFYFLSNDEVLEVLAQIKHPAAVQPHLIKCFDNIKALEFAGPGSPDVTAMVSSEGEVVPLAKALRARGEVEKWLLVLEQVMVLTLRRLARVAVQSYEGADRTAWVFDHPAQLVLVVTQIVWCSEMEAALQAPNPGQAIERQCRRCYQQLGDLVSITARPLKSLQRQVLTALLTTEVHARDLADEVRAEGVQRATEFGWTKQLRFVWTPDDEGQAGDIAVLQNNSRFPYGWEYLGCPSRLVVTPLTDRIYMTITGALHLRLGCAPSGPAGTGKTETVKDLAKGMARHCIVYNCSDGVTYRMMERFFAGLVQAGAWCCLDEFNRINVEVLSVIAAQLLEIQQAMLRNAMTFTFQGTPNLFIRYTYGAFITMNPDYAGRTELPDNLKVLFRPVAVMTPDFRLIAEVVLFSEGFQGAKGLSQKVTQLFKLASEQLSPQDHYDFGMRAVKSILMMAGGLKRAHPDVDEALTLIRACRDANLPKFLAADLPLFNAILSDLFPGVVVPATSYGELESVLLTCMQEKRLRPVPSFLQKVLQFHETLTIRHGVMLVGPSTGGKTCNRDVLAAGRGRWPKPAAAVPQAVLNPKAITYAELYGHADPLTQEWTDGVLAIVLRDVAEAAEARATDAATAHWVVFDGPVDTLWVESLNSVLDDSKLLCFDNGVRMKLPGGVSLVFEVQDLAVASPATVSRCGMVYMDHDEVGWPAVVEAWMDHRLKGQLSEDAFAHLRSLFMSHCAPGLDFVRVHCKVLFQAPEISVVQSLCDLWLALVQREKLVLRDPTDAGHVRELINLCFAFAYVWAVGGNVDQPSQEAFDAFVREEMEAVCTFPGFGLCHDFCVDAQLRRLVPWESRVPTYTHDPRKPFFQILVPTVDTERYAFLLEVLLAARKPVLFNGPTGVGKSVIVQACLRAQQETLHLIPVPLQFSAQTSSARVQEIVEGKLKARRRAVMAPPPGCVVALFVDDLNMPCPEEYGASPPLELLRQLLGQGALYDRKGLFLKAIQDVYLCAACGPPQGSGHPVPPRLLRFFHLLQIPSLSEDCMRRIFMAILGGYLGPFMREVRDLVKPMVHGSVEIFLRLKAELRPRLSTPHYTFNLRDLAKVVQGICMVSTRTCQTAHQATQLWLHENLRCFHDRLATPADRRFFTEELLLDVFKHNFPNTGHLTHDDVFGEPILWADFLQPGVPAEERRYEHVAEPDRLPRLFDEYLDEYNLTTPQILNLVFFPDHCQHLVRICRILRQPRGNALLVGIAGCGKRSLTRLAAAVAEFRCFQIEVGRSYGMAQFHDDLSLLYDIAGVAACPVVFLLSDSQLVAEGMLEDVNNILNTGEAPAMLGREEKDRKINACLEAARDAGVGGSRDAVYSFLIDRVRDNLRVVLCMSPIGDPFRTRCRQFPSLVNCCTIDWFDEWPQTALHSVATRLLSELSDQTILDALARVCVEIHCSIVGFAREFCQEVRRHYYVTPVSYLEFLSLYLCLLDEKRAEMATSIQRLRNGKQRMAEANAEIDRMQEELTQMQPLLEAARSRTEAATTELEVQTAQASQVRDVVAAQEQEAKEQQQLATGLQMEAKADLDGAMPELHAAMRALDSLNKSDIGEIRGYQTVPKMVEKTLTAVMIVLREPKTDWEAAKAALGNPAFLQRLRDYDKDNIPLPVITKLKKFIDDPDFTPEKVGTAGSAACRSLCMWCRAIDMYHTVYRAVAPKRATLERAQTALDEMNGLLAAAQAKLQVVEGEVEQLHATLRASLTERDDLEHRIATSLRRLQAASLLTSSIGAEVIRWDALLGTLQAEEASLPLTTFLSAVCVAYFGAFTPQYRARMLRHWIGLLEREGLEVPTGYTMHGVMTTPSQVQDWRLQGLPSDLTSLENAVVANACTSTKSRRWPLMVDPQGQARRWILNLEKDDNLQVLRTADPLYLRSLELAIRNGLPVMIEDLEETIDPVLEPVLMKQVYHEGGRMLLNLGGPENAIDYDPHFRLYLVTKVANPHFLPDVCIRVALLNFTVTPEGLEEQILADVVRLERRELEEAHAELIQGVAEDQRKLKYYEDSVLAELQAVAGNILDNERVIESCQESQATSQLIAARLVESEEKAASIAVARGEYRPVAARASLLYFVVAALPNVLPMYQYSLDYFKALLADVITTTPASDELADHLEVLVRRCTAATHAAVSRGLFARHRLLFSFLIAVAIQRQDGAIPPPEWQGFLRGVAVDGRDSARAANPCPDLLSTSKWDALQGLARLNPGLAELAADFGPQAPRWAAWLQPPVGASPLPAPWAEQLGPWERLLVRKVLRPENLLSAVQEFVQEVLGPCLVGLPPPDLAQAFADSAPGTPLLFLLAPGANAVAAISRLAEGQQPTPCLRFVSLGQGQGAHARQSVEAGMKAGQWVLLENCHLASSFLRDLQALVESFAAPDTEMDPGFRLWLTSMPLPTFPIQVLQRCLKLALETPQGLRAHLVRSLAEVDPEAAGGEGGPRVEATEDDDADSSDAGSTPRSADRPQSAPALAPAPDPHQDRLRRLGFALCFFHAVVQERRKFGPLGWNVGYEFSATDLQVSQRWLAMLLQDAEVVPWQALRFIVGEVNYGGRVTDFQDRRLLLCILDRCLSPQVLQADFCLAAGLPPVPTDGGRAALLAHAEALPSADDPALFGLHANADLRFQSQESAFLLEAILSLQPRTAATAAEWGGGPSAEQLAVLRAEEVE